MDRRFEDFLRASVSKKGKNAGRRLSGKTIQTYLSDLLRIEEYYGDVDYLYDSGGLDDVESSMRRRSNAPAPRFATPLPQSSNAYASPIAWYREFGRSLAERSNTNQETDEALALFGTTSSTGEPPQAFEPLNEAITGEGATTVSAAPYKGGLEGIVRETLALNRSRNRGLIEAVRKRDNRRCQACGFRREFRGKFIIEVHHLYPLADGERAASSEDCICLCPNCHRLAHTQRDRPIPLDELRRIVAS